MIPDIIEGYWEATYPNVVKHDNAYYFDVLDARHDPDGIASGVDNPTMEDCMGRGAMFDAIARCPSSQKEAMISFKAHGAYFNGNDKTVCHEGTPSYIAMAFDAYQCADLPIVLAYGDDTGITLINVTKLITKYGDIDHKDMSVRVKNKVIYTGRTQMSVKLSACVGFQKNQKGTHDATIKWLEDRGLIQTLVYGYDKWDMSKIL